MEIKAGWQNNAIWVEENIEKLCEYKTDYIAVGIPSSPEEIISRSYFNQDIVDKIHKCGKKAAILISINHDIRGKFTNLKGKEYVQKISDEQYVKLNDVTYMMIPTREWETWIIDMIKAAVEQGYDIIMLEEPEYWLGTDYSEIFKKRFFDTYGYNLTWDNSSISISQWYDMTRLKREMIFEMIYYVLKEAKAYISQKNKNVLLGINVGPITKYGGEFSVPHYRLLTELQLLDFYFTQNYPDTVMHNDGFNDNPILDSFSVCYGENILIKNAAKFGNIKWGSYNDPVNEVRYNNKYRQNYAADKDAIKAHNDIFVNAIIHGAEMYNQPWLHRVIDKNDNLEVPMDYLKTIKKEYEFFFENHVDKTIKYDPVAILHSGEREIFNGFWKVRFDIGGPVDNLDFSYLVLIKALLSHAIKPQALWTELLNRYGIPEEIKVILCAGEDGGFISNPKDGFTLKQWVENGGSLVWLGSDGQIYDGNKKILDVWLNSPLFDLFNEYLKINHVQYSLLQQSKTWRSLNLEHPIVKLLGEEIAVDSPIGYELVDEFSNSEIIYKSEGVGGMGGVAVLETNVLKGKFVYIGIPSTYFITEDNIKLLSYIVKYCLGYDINTPSILGNKLNEILF